MSDPATQAATPAPAAQPSATPTANAPIEQPTATSTTHDSVGTPAPPSAAAEPSAVTQPPPTSASVVEPTSTVTAVKSEPGSVEPSTSPVTQPPPTITSGVEPTSTTTAAKPEPGATASPSSITETPVLAAASAPGTTATSSDISKTPAAEVPAPTAASSPEKSPAEEEQEPQSALTERFTEAEWSALKEFRAVLPQIFADGYPDNPKAKDIPIVFWGVRIDPNSPKDARVSVVLMKFLRARNLSISEAREMLVSTLRWRESFNIDAVLKEDFPEDVFGQVGHIYGHDKEGRPVVYNRYGGDNISEVFRDVERFIRWRVALQEKSIALLNFTEVDQTVQVHDYEGVSLTSRDANSKNAASEATNIFQSHYPELLHKKFFVNVPTLLNWIFWVFKPLISANTLAKMSVVGTGRHAIKKVLLPIVDVDELPERYGGNAKAF